jgi:hypothetical protein
LILRQREAFLVLERVSRRGVVSMTEREFFLYIFDGCSPHRLLVIEQLAKDGDPAQQQEYPNRKEHSPIEKGVEPVARDFALTSLNIDSGTRPPIA